MMKRLILSMLITLLTAVSMQAARAYSEPCIVTQPDGSQLTIILYGDEHIHWLTTSDGVFLVEQDKGYYVAAINDKGMLTATPMLAHQQSTRSANELQLCAAQQERKALFFDRADRIMQETRRAKVSSVDFFPHTGSPKCLVILANFSDVKFTVDDPVKSFTQYFNGETQETFSNNEGKNLVGVKKYFEHSSHGQFTPQFDIVGPIDLPETQAYYGTDINTAKGNYDALFNQFCEDAIAAVDDEVDFTQYVNRTANYAELVCVIYAGCGQSVNGNPSNTIWPKCSRPTIVTNDGVTVGYMNCSPELYKVGLTDINGIGLFCHEFSHGMGLPDLYATNKSAQINNQTPEFWDLMDYGEYASNGYAPVPYTAWEQEAMEWIEIETLTDSQKGIELIPLLHDGKAYKFGNGTNNEEWMIIENVQPRDNTNKIPGFAYGHGLLVSHIAYSKENVSMTDYPNNKAGTPRVCIVPADGLVINGYQFGNDKPYSQIDYTNSLKGDPFPGTSIVTELTAAQELPNYKFYNGDASPAASLKNITENTSTGVVTFDFDNGTTTIIDIQSDREYTDAHYYTMDGRRLNGRPTHSGLFIYQGRKVIVR